MERSICLGWINKMDKRGHGEGHVLNKANEKPPAPTQFSISLNLPNLIFPYSSWIALGISHSKELGLQTLDRSLGAKSKVWQGWGASWKLRGVT